MLPDLSLLLTRFDPATGEIAGAAAVRRRLSDLRGCFADSAAYAAMLAAGDPVIYTVATAEPGAGDGALSLGVGCLMPGKVGREYFLTKGHLHSWRDASEVYIGLAGEGLLLLEEEGSGESRIVPLRPNHAVYVPGRTAHRTVNVGDVPLSYVGIYPAKAGHDYEAIAGRNFRCVVLEENGAPVLRNRPGLPGHP